MKKERIEITKGNNIINFFLIFGKESVWLFSQEYSMSVYEYFKDGRSVGEIKKNTFWKTNRRLAKTIDRIPAMVRSARKEYQIPYKDGKRRYFNTTYRDMYAI